MPDIVPTLYEWCGGYAPHCTASPTSSTSGCSTTRCSSRSSGNMSPDHRDHVARWLGEVFGGPADYTDQLGGYPHMLSHHLGLAITEEQRARWAQLIAQSADEAGLPDDPEFRSAFVAYVEWGTRHRQGQLRAGRRPAHGLPDPALGLGRGAALPPGLIRRPAGSPVRAHADRTGGGDRAGRGPARRMYDNRPAAGADRAHAPPAPSAPFGVPLAADVVARLSPSVVTVRAGDGIGSGVVYQPDVVITNQHVVAGRRHGDDRLCRRRVVRGHRAGRRRGHRPRGDPTARGDLPVPEYRTELPRPATRSSRSAARSASRTP